MSYCRAKILLNTPAATELGEKVALSRRIDKHWRLIGKSLFLFSTLDLATDPAL